MTHSYQVTFPIRHYECDQYGHVNHVNYLRFMQEAAILASADAGFDMARHERMGRYWLIRDSDIEYLSPLVYGDSVTIRTWVNIFRRVRCQREYRFFNQHSEQVARALTDWIFLEQETNRPAAIPDELVVAFLPDGQTPEAAQREGFPQAPDPPAGVFSRTRRVQWQDIDTAGHVNNAVYLAYLQDIGVEICNAYGWPIERMSADGFGIIARRARIQYRQPALLGDTLEIETWVSDARRSTAQRHYTIRRLGETEPLVRARILWVWVDLSSQRPIRIPQDFLTDFRPNFI